MPNHVTHRLTITGPKEDIDRFLAERFLEQEDGGLAIDFQKIIPMPAALEDSTSGGGVSIGLFLLNRTDVPTEFGGPLNVDQYLTYPWVKEAGVENEEQLRDLLAKRHPSAIDEAKKSIAAYEETGYISWYPWSINNWGTKWNAYSGDTIREDDQTLELVFDTAWSPPEPIFQKLGELYPLLAIDGYAFDEGWNFEAVIAGANGDWTVECRTATAETYEKVYGEAYEPYEEDEEAAAE